MLKITQTIVNNIRTNKSLYSTRLKSTVATAQKKNSEFDSDKLKTNNIVAAAFAALNPEKPKWDVQTPITDKKLESAKSIDDLLSVTEGSGISRQHALKVVSTLAEWSSVGKVKITDFENDLRFIKMCRILSKGAKINKNMIARSDDLSTVISVTAEDEAARLIGSLDLPQLVKVMSALAVRKRRSIVLLRTIAFHLLGRKDRLEIKQCADLLYAMCQLNFIDENLITRICGDISHEIKNDFSKSSVIGSIITSLGLLKFKNSEILDILSEWVVRNQKICRTQDLFSLFITLGTVNYLPNNYQQLLEEIVPQLTEAEAKKPSLWLSFVWSLTILNQVTPEHIQGVLSQDFTNKCLHNPSVVTNLKLLNINGTAKHLLKDTYEGDLLLPDSQIYSVEILKTKEKKQLVEMVVSTLRNLIQKNFCLNRNTDFGFCIDIECLLDSKCTALEATKENLSRSDVTKVAIVVYDYHDMCIGDVAPTGVNILMQRLLEQQNYKVLTVPYTEFKATDKLVNRVQYLENKLKKIVK